MADITIENLRVAPGLGLRTPTTARAYARTDFLLNDADHTSVKASSPHDGGPHFKAWTLEAVSTIYFTPTGGGDIIVPSTTDSPDNPSGARWGIAIFDANDRFMYWAAGLESFFLEPTPTTVDAEIIAATNGGTPVISTPRDYTVNNLTVEGDATVAGTSTFDGPAVFNGTVSGAVKSFNGRDGVVTLLSGDLNGLDGSGLVGVGTGTGGVENTGSTTVGADTDEDDVGVVALQTRNLTRVQINNDGSSKFYGVVGLPRLAAANLPTPADGGWLAEQTDGLRGIVRYTGTGWVSVSGPAKLMDFGAVGDGTTDDSAALQAAIQAVYDAGGGEIYMPAKRFKLAGALDPTHHSVITLPQAPAGQAPRTIKLRGEAVERTSGNPPAFGGTVLDASERAAIAPAVGLANYASVISGKIYSATTSLSEFNYVYFEMENVLIRLTGNSYLGGLQLHNIIGCRLRNVQITPGEDAGPSMTEPTNTNNIGVVLPGVNNHAQVSLQGVSMYGMHTGIIASEHAHFIGDNYVSYGKVGLELEQGGHINWGKIGVELCQTHIKRSGGGNSTLDMTLTGETDRTSGTWRQCTYEIDDPSSLIYGRLKVEMTQPAAAAYVSVRRNGGINLTTMNLRTGRVEGSLGLGGTSSYASTNGTLLAIHDNNTAAYHTLQGYPSGGHFECYLSNNAIQQGGVWAQPNSAKGSYRLVMSSVNDEISFGRAPAGGTGLIAAWATLAKLTAPAAGETGLWLLDGSTATLKRVKMGAAGTGPGGVGKALYVET